MDGGVNLVLLVSCVLLLVSVVAVRVASRTGLPALLVYLAIGLAVGSAGLGLHPDYRLTGDLGLIALAVILAEGGLTTRWDVVRPALPFAVVLSTIGVAVSVAVVAGLCSLVLSTDLRTSLLLGSIVASTDAAAVFSVLRRLPLRPSLRAVLEAESGLNDAPVVVLVVLVSGPDWASASPARLLATVLFELVAGAGLGLAAGVLGRQLLQRVALPSAGLYPLATVGLVLLAYSGGTAAHASGFLAAYVSGLVLGAARLPHRRAVLGFASSLALMAEAALFVLLGLLVSPDRLLPSLPDALVVGLAATLVGRPLAVALTALPFRVPWREQGFLAWAGLRGAVPIVLATLAVTAGVPGGARVVDIVFVLVVVFTLVQAPTLPLVARLLHVVDPGQVRELEVEAAPLDDLRADLLRVRVVPGSRLSGVYVDELRLPAGAQVTLVVRDGRALVPGPSTALLVGDSVLFVVPSDVRIAVEDRLRAVARGGKLARWLGGGNPAGPRAVDDE